MQIYPRPVCILERFLCWSRCSSITNEHSRRQLLKKRWRGKERAGNKSDGSWQRDGDRSRCPVCIVNSLLEVLGRRREAVHCKCCSYFISHLSEEADGSCCWWTSTIQMWFITFDKRQNIQWQKKKEKDKWQRRAAKLRDTSCKIVSTFWILLETSPTSSANNLSTNAAVEL